MSLRAFHRNSSHTESPSSQVSAVATSPPHTESMIGAQRRCTHVGKCTPLVTDPMGTSHASYPG